MGQPPTVERAQTEGTLRKGAGKSARENRGFPKGNGVGTRSQEFSGQQWGILGEVPKRVPQLAWKTEAHF